MLYTKKGDGGETGLWEKGKRVSKSSPAAEALGALDSVNSFLGLVKVKADAQTAERLAEVQQNLFTIQAEVAGADKKIAATKVTELEAIINQIEKELPPITSFLVSGGTELSALLDYARTLARAAERRVVAAHEERDLGAATLAYLNRLSSLLYALARLENHKSGIKEERPRYN